MKLEVSCTLVLEDLEALTSRLPTYRRVLEELNPEAGAGNVMESHLTHAILTRFKSLTRKEVTKMLSVSMLKESVAVQECMEESCKEGLDEGLRRGQKKGLREGRKEGKLEAARHLMLELWTLRFGAPEGWVLHRLTRCSSVDLLELLFRQVVVASGQAEAEQQVKLALGMEPKDRLPLLI